MYVQQGSSATTGSSGVQSLSSWTKIITVEQSHFQIRRNSFSISAPLWVWPPLRVPLRECRGSLWARARSRVCSRARLRVREPVCEFESRWAALRVALRVRRARSRLRVLAPLRDRVLLASLTESLRCTPSPAERVPHSETKLDGVTTGWHHLRVGQSSLERRQSLLTAVMKMIFDPANHPCLSYAHLYNIYRLDNNNNNRLERRFF